MKFTKSERHIHQNNYNPPCNVYQPDHLLYTNKILTGSLATPTLVHRNTFGFQHRFQKQKSNVPGPGAYAQIQYKKKFESKPDNFKNKVSKIKKDSQINATPSIPYSYYGQNNDQQQQKYIKSLIMNQNVSQACKSLKKKEPAFSFAKSQRQYSYLPKNIEIKQAEKKQFIQIEANQMNQQKQQYKKTSLIWHQKIKRANERRLQIIQALDPQFVPSLQLIQLINKKKNKTAPGPGDYINNQTNNHPQYQLFQNPKGISFTTVKRFSVDKVDILGPGLYNPKKLESSQKFSFGRSEKNLFQHKDQTNFRFYINPQPNSIKQSEQIKSLRGSSCPFGSSVTRFPQVIQNETKPLTLDEQRKRKQNQKLKKMIKTRLKLQQRKTSIQDKQQGLLGISTMASTIQ